MFDAKNSDWPKEVLASHVEAWSYWKKDEDAPNSKPIYTLRFYHLDATRNLGVFSKLSRLHRYSATVMGEAKTDGAFEYRAEVYTRSIDYSTIKGEENMQKKRHLESLHSYAGGSYDSLSSISHSIFSIIAKDLNAQADTDGESSINL